MVFCKKINILLGRFYDQSFRFLHEVSMSESTVASSMTLYSAKTWVGISSYSFMIFFLRTEGLSGLKLLLGNDSHLLFVRQ